MWYNIVLLVNVIYIKSVFDCVLICWLVLYGKVDVLIAYYCSTQSYHFGHYQLHTNNIVCICAFWMVTYYLYHLVKYIIISIACVGRVDILNGFRILLLWTCISLMYVSFFVHFQWAHTGSSFFPVICVFINVLVDAVIYCDLPCHFTHFFTQLIYN